MVITLSVIDVALSVLDETLSLLFCPECLLCGKLTSRKMACSDCLAFERVTNLSFHEIQSAYWLNDSASRLIHKIKFEGRYEALWALEEALAKASLPDEGVLIPVPLHRKRWIARGFNQSEWLARRWGREVLTQGLFKKTETSPQSVLSKRDREKNLKGVFAWNPKVRVPENIVLIDDICTTGSTLKTCGEVLRQAGAKKVSAWTLFRTPGPAFSAPESPY